MGEEINKKKFEFSKKFLLILIACGAIYGGFKYFKNKREQEILAQKELNKFNNIESEIFDLSDSENSPDSAGHSRLTDSELSELTVEQLKESGAEFIYQLLLRNQLQIANLKEELRDLNDNFSRYKAQEKISKIIFSYVELRQKLFSKQNYNRELESFEFLSLSDKTLCEKIAKLKADASNFDTAKNLQKEFKSLIPEIIAAKKHDKNGNFLEKIRFSLAKIIVVRHKDIEAQNVDGKILRIEKFLNEMDYQNALAELVSLDAKYNEIIKNYIDKLNKINEIYKIDKEIMDHLRSLS